MAGPLDAPDRNDPPGNGRVEPLRRESRDFVSLLTSRVGEVFLRKPYVADGGTDLVTLCRALAERGIGDALIRDGDRLGVFTTTNLRDALLRPEPPAELPVREVATFEPVAVGTDDELYHALILMLRHRIHRLLVRDATGEVVGVLSQLDLMGFVANHSHIIAVQVAQAEDVVSLRDAARQVDTLIRLLQEDGVRVEVIAGLVSELNRQIMAKLWSLLAPVELQQNATLVVMGSEGRGEQIIKTDQDNALILRDGFAFDGLEAVTARFTETMIDFGYPPCPGGIMLSRPLWCQPLDAFRATIRDWIFGADPAGVMNLAIFIDAAAVAGDPELLAAARAEIDRSFGGDLPRLARFAAAVDQFGNDGSWWSRLPGLRGREAAEIDIKKLGIFPLVHGVRALALQYRIPALGTADRIAGLEADGRIDPGLARDLVDALRFLIGLKLSNNLAQIAAGTTPSNAIRLSDLGKLQREALKEALATVREFRQWIGRHFRLDAL